MKRQPPELSREELLREASSLLRRHFDPIAATDFLLQQFSGWDLKAIIEKIRKEHEQI